MHFKAAIDRIGRECIYSYILRFRTGIFRVENRATDHVQHSNKPSQNGILGNDHSIRSHQSTYSCVCISLYESLHGHCAEIPFSSNESKWNENCYREWAISYIALHCRRRLPACLPNSNSNVIATTESRSHVSLSANSITHSLSMAALQSTCACAQVLVCVCEWVIKQLLLSLLK